MSELKTTIHMINGNPIYRITENYSTKDLKKSDINTPVLEKVSKTKGKGGKKKNV